MARETLGGMWNRRSPNRDGRCLSSFGTPAMSSSNTVSIRSHLSLSRLINCLVFVKDPPLWSLNIMNGTNMWFDDILCNATAINAPFGTNWVQNTDGFDTMDANNIKLTNFVYQGGDDCIALKPRSYNIYAQNVS